MQGKGKAYTQLVGAATVEVTVEVPQKARNRATI